MRHDTQDAQMFRALCRHGLSLTLIVGSEEVTVARMKEGEAWAPNHEPFERGVRIVAGVLTSQEYQQAVLADALSDQRGGLSQ